LLILKIINKIPRPILLKIGYSKIGSKFIKMVKDYVMDLKKRVNPNSVSTYLYAIQAFLETNDIELNWKKIRRPGLI